MANYQSGGAFQTSGDYQPTGTWDYSKATVTGLTVTGEVLTNPTVNGSTLTASGTALNTAVTEANTAALIAGGTQALTPASTGTITLIAAAAVDRTVLINCNVTTVFANGDGAQPTFAIGQTGSTSKFAATSVFTGAAANTARALSGTLTANTALLITATAGTGTTETGSMTVSAIAVP